MKRTPALFSGLGFLVGIALALTQNLWVALPLVPLCTQRRQALALLIPLLFGLTYARITVSAPDLDKARGTAHLHIEHISKQARGKGWRYQGHLKRFDGEVFAKKIPIRWSSPVRLVGECDYRVQGHLTRKGRYYRLQLGKEAVWEPASGSRSFAERRFGTSSTIKTYLSHHLTPRSAQFLTSLATGESADQSLLFDFSRLGLVHLMAVSGFHFSLVAALLALLLRPLLPYKLHALIAALLLSLYFGFIGASASVLRAWIMALMGFTALIIERQNTALNALGVALIIVLFADPYAIFSIGFQYSFLCTASILVFYRPTERILSRLFPRFRLKEVWKMSLLDQHGFLLSTFVRKTLALGVAVNIAALPLTLLLFHRFPWIGLVCNLFFPALITLALFLLPFALLAASLLPWLGRALFALEEGIVQFALDFTRYLPAYFDFQWVTAALSPHLMLALLTACAGIISWIKRGHERTCHPLLPVTRRGRGGVCRGGPAPRNSRERV